MRHLENGSVFDETKRPIASHEGLVSIVILSISSVE